MNSVFKTIISVLLITVPILKAEDVTDNWYAFAGTNALRGSYEISGADDSHLKGYGLNATVGRRLNEHYFTSLSLFPQWMELESDGGYTTDIESLTTVALFSSTKHLPYIFYGGGSYTDGTTDYFRQQGGNIVGTEGTHDWSIFGDASYSFSYEDGTTITPTLNLTYRRSKAGGYTESGLTGNEIQFEGGRRESFVSTLSILLESPVSARFTPYVDASWQHEFMEQSMSIRSRSLAVNGLGFTTPSSFEAGRDTLTGKAGIQFFVNQNLNFEAYASFASQDKLKTKLASLSATYSF